MLSTKYYFLTSYISTKNIEEIDLFCTQYLQFVYKMCLQKIEKEKVINLYKIITINASACI